MGGLYGSPARPCWTHEGDVPDGGMRTFFLLPPMQDPRVRSVRGFVTKIHSSQGLSSEKKDQGCCAQVQVKLSTILARLLRRRADSWLFSPNRDGFPARFSGTTSS